MMVLFSKIDENKNNMPSLSAHSKNLRLFQGEEDWKFCYNL